MLGHVLGKLYGDILKPTYGNNKGENDE
jgi:hypothetical protein